MTLSPALQKPAPPVALLEEGLSAARGWPARVVSLEEEALEGSSHPIARLRVGLASGEEVPVICKRPQPGRKGTGSANEVLIYRRLLAGGRFGAPLLYAALEDEGGGSSLLLLEDVGEDTLAGADRGDWREAFRWLARMHAAYAGRADELRALGCLSEQDESYYQSLRQRARAHVAAGGTPGGGERFDRLMRGWGALVDWLVRQPRTLVHGDIFAQNLHVQPGPVVRPVDWEDAAVGLGAWDLARLLDGWGSDKPAFVACYLEEFARHAALPGGEAAFRAALARCAILNALWHLAWSEEDCRDTAFVGSVLDRVEWVWQRLGGRAGDG
jgi:hypothetical protein